MMKQKAFDFFAMESEKDFPYLTTLNPPQREAVTHFEGPILVLAGAGSGKTRVLTHRIAHLILCHNVKPGNILAVTFTNKATAEMKSRLTATLGAGAEKLWVSTFHSACLRILRRHPEPLGYEKNFVIYDDRDSRGVLKEVLKKLSIDEKQYPVESFQKKMDALKNRYITVSRYSAMAESYDETLTAQVYAEYQQQLLQANAMDFGDLLVNAVKLLESNRDILELYQHYLRFILVDEFQDTNDVQYRLIKLLAAPQNNLLVVGDDDQSIYAFRGATINNILDFEKDFPGAHTVTLEQNYRSTANILDLAYSVIQSNKDRKPKKLRTDRGQGDKITAYTAYDESEEASFIAKEIYTLHDQNVNYEDIAIFYRTNFQSRALEEALLNLKIPYRIFGGLKFYDRKEIKDILSYLKLLINPADNQSFLRVLNTPPRGIGSASVKKIADTAAAKEISLWNAAAEHRGNRKIAAFLDLMESVRSTALDRDVATLIEFIVDKSGYKARLEHSKDRQDLSRLENLQELQAVAQLTVPGVSSLGDGLGTFLDRVSLSSSADGVGSENADEGGVSLMTLHLAKGLEYPYVFLTGLEEGLLPHHRSRESARDLEEERRLCYVGITRAMSRLYLSRARTRGFYSASGGFGATGRFREGSRFIHEMNPDVIESRGRDFFEDSNVEYEPEAQESSLWDVDADGEMVNPFNRKIQKTNRQSHSAGKAFSHLLSTADKLGEAAPDLTRGLEPLKPGDEAAGLRVAHPVFGKGTITEIDTRGHLPPARKKIEVQFDELSGSRKLIVGKARLHLLEE